jgi:hypothetical protein
MKKITLLFSLTLLAFTATAQTTGTWNKVTARDTFWLSGRALAEIVYAVTSASRNNESPTAKAVYDYVTGQRTFRRVITNGDADHTIGAYRAGTTGFRTEDTTGVVNVRTRTGKTGEVITADTSANGTMFLSLKPPAFGNPGLANLQPFNFYAQRFLSVNMPLSVRPNYVWGMGYNLGTNGAILNTHEAAGGIHFETYFQNAALGGGGATGMTEFHLFSIDTFGNTNRFISNVEPWDGRRDASQVTIKTDKLSFNDRVNSAVWQHNPLTNLWTFSDTTSFRFDEPRGFGLSVLNGAAGSYLSVMDFNGTDTLEVARQNTPAVKIHPNLVLNNGQVYAGAGSAGTIKLGSNAAVTQLNVFGNTSVGSSSLGARLFVYNDNSSTSAASADSWSVMQLRNRNSTNNNWSAIQFNSSAGTIAADVAVQYVNQASHFADIAFHTRGSSTGFGEAFRITSEKLIRVPTLGATPTVLVGRNSSNDLSSTSLSSELTISSGTLKLAQQSATSGQVLEWNGSTWAPATDDTGSGVTGSGASPQVAYWSGASALTGNSSFLYQSSILKVKNSNALTGFLNNDAQQNIQIQNTDATNNNWASITNYTSAGTVNAALAFQNVDQTSRESAVDIWGFSTSSFLRLARFKHDGITLDRPTTISGAATFSSTTAHNGAATFSAGITANTSASNFNSQINSGSSSAGNIAYFWNDYASTSVAGSNAFASIVLKNRDATANNWTALEWDSQTGQIAGSMAMQFLDHTNDYGDIVFHTRGSGGFLEGLRVTSERRVGVGTSAPASKLDVEGGVSIGAAYSGTTAAPSNGAIIEGSVGVGNNNPQTKFHVTTATGTTTPILRIENTGGDADIFVSNATPEGSITGSPGDIALRTDSGNGKVYVKGSGTGNTGWVELGTSSGSSFYQTLQIGGTDQTQRAKLNISPTAQISVAYSDDAGGNRSNVEFSIANDAVGTAQIDDGTVGSADLNQMGASTSQVLTWNGSAWAAQYVDADQNITDLSANANNWNPTNWATENTFTVGSNNLWNITGFTALPGGTERTIINSGSVAIIVPIGHPDSDAANQVQGPSDYIIGPYGGSIIIRYSNNFSKWYVTSCTFNPAMPGTNGAMSHYYNASVGATTGADWGTIGFGISSGANATTAPSTTVPAGWEIGTSTSAAGIATLYLSKTVLNPTLYSSAYMVTSTIVYIPTLSDGTQTFTFQFGLVPSPSSTTLNVNNSVAIRYTNGTNSGKWQGFSRDNSGTESTVDLGVTVAAGTRYVLTVVVDKAKTEGRFFINGSYAGRVTANLPNNVAVGTRAGIFKSAGTTSRTAIIPTYTFYTIYP